MMKKNVIIVVMGLLLAFTGGVVGAAVGAELEEGMDVVFTSIDPGEEMEFCEEGFPIVTPETDGVLREGTVITYVDGDEKVVELYDNEGEEAGVEDDRNLLPLSAGIGGIILVGGMALVSRKKK